MVSMTKTSRAWRYSAILCGRLSSVYLSGYTVKVYIKIYFGVQDQPLPPRYWLCTMRLIAWRHARAGSKPSVGFALTRLMGWRRWS